jgi:hypothetical protein
VGQEIKKLDPENVSKLDLLGIRMSILRVNSNLLMVDSGVPSTQKVQ